MEGRCVVFLLILLCHLKSRPLIYATGYDPRVSYYFPRPCFFPLFGQFHYNGVTIFLSLFSFSVFYYFLLNKYNGSFFFIIIILLNTYLH